MKEIIILVLALTMLACNQQKFDKEPLCVKGKLYMVWHDIGVMYKVQETGLNCNCECEIIMQQVNK